MTKDFTYANAYDFVESIKKASSCDRSTAKKEISKRLTELWTDANFHAYSVICGRYKFANLESDEMYDAFIGALHGVVTDCAKVVEPKIKELHDEHDLKELTREEWLTIIFTSIVLNSMARANNYAELFPKLCKSTYNMDETMKRGAMIAMLANPLRVWLEVICDNSKGYVKDPLIKKLCFCVSRIFEDHEKTPFGRCTMERGRNDEEALRCCASITLDLIKVHSKIASTLEGTIFTLMM